MANNEGRSSVPFILGVLAAVALVVWLVLLMTGSEEAADTTQPPTTGSSIPGTTAPSTTETPTTTEPPTSTTDTSPSTTEASEAEAAEVTVEEDLVRLFPVSAGWIIESTDDAVTVGAVVGPQECYGLASAEIEESSDEVAITLTAGFRPDATGCSGMGPHWSYTFPLDSPLGDRTVVDAHTGEELGTEPPDSGG